jgi:hypothetical protein
MNDPDDSIEIRAEYQFALWASVWVMIKLGVLQSRCVDIL